MNSPGPTSSRAISRSARKGEMKATIVIRPASTKSLATSPTRRIFSTRSASVKPRSRLSPCRHTMLLAGGNVRHGLNREIGFTDADRVENIRRVGEVAKLMSEAGLIVLCSFISPFRAERRMVRELTQPTDFIEIFVDTPLDECIRRDPKGLYAKAKAGRLEHFTGLDSPYETPESPELRVTTMGTTPERVVEHVLDELRRRDII